MRPAVGGACEAASRRATGCWSSAAAPARTPSTWRAAGCGCWRPTPRGMVAAARRKVAAAGSRQLVEVRQLAFEELAGSARRPFDGAFSSFGGFNCVARPRGPARDLAALLRPGAASCSASWGRWCPGSGYGSWSEASRQRLSAACGRGGAGLAGMTIRYPAIGAMQRAFAPAFRLRRTAALGAVPAPLLCRALGRAASSPARPARPLGAPRETCRPSPGSPTTTCWSSSADERRRRLAVGLPGLSPGSRPAVAARRRGPLPGMRLRRPVPRGHLALPAARGGGALRRVPRRLHPDPPGRAAGLRRSRLLPRPAGLPAGPPDRRAMGAAPAHLRHRHPPRPAAPRRGPARRGPRRRSGLALPPPGPPRPPPHGDRPHHRRSRRPGRRPALPPPASDETAEECRMAGRRPRPATGEPGPGPACRPSSTACRCQLARPTW